MERRIVLPTRSREATRRRPEITARIQRTALVAPVILLASSRESLTSLMIGLIGGGCPLAPGGVIAARMPGRFERSSGLTLNEEGSGLWLPGSSVIRFAWFRASN